MTRCGKLRCNWCPSSWGFKIIKDCTPLSVRRTNKPASSIPVDQTIEQIVNRSAKSCGGIIGMSRNTQAYEYDRWCLTRHKQQFMLLEHSPGSICMMRKMHWAKGTGNQKSSEVWMTLRRPQKPSRISQILLNYCMMKVYCVYLHAKLFQTILPRLLLR